MLLCYFCYQCIRCYRYHYYYHHYYHYYYHYYNHFCPFALIITIINIIIIIIMIKSKLVYICILVFIVGTLVTIDGVYHSSAGIKKRHDICFIKAKANTLKPIYPS